MRIALGCIASSMMIACSSTPPSETIADGTTHPISTTAPPATTATADAPAPAAPALDKPFALAARFDEAHVELVGDKLFILDSQYDADPDKVTHTVFELKGTRFEKVGDKSYSKNSMDSVQGVVEDKNTVYLTVAFPVGRSGGLRYDPIRGPGRSVNLGDINAEGWARLMRHNPPSCGEPPVDGKAAMKRSNESYESGSDYFIIGEPCEGGSRVLQIVDSRAKTSRFVPLEASAYMVDSNLGVALVTDQIAVWDGNAFKPSAPRPPEGTTSLLKGPEGVLFATGTGDSYVLRDKTWVTLALPEGGKKFELRMGAQKLWAFVGKFSQATSEVYQYVPPGGEAPKVAERFEGGAARSASARPTPSFSKNPAGPRCGTNLVVLYGFTKVTPDDYDFPLTRKAIKGHPELDGVRFVIAEENTKKYFVGKAPSFDKAKRLAKVIEDGVKGSKPQIVCSEPKVLRELPINLTTGEVKK